MASILASLGYIVRVFSSQIKMQSEYQSQTRSFASGYKAILGCVISCRFDKYSEHTEIDQIVQTIL